MSDPTATLAAIDAVLADRCACGCGELLDPAGPSAWFAGEECQRRWHGRQAHPALLPENQLRDVDYEAWRRWRNQQRIAAYVINARDLLRITGY